MDSKGIEGYVANHLRLFLSMAAGLLVFVGIAAVSVFFVFVRGAEETMVPDVRGKDLTAALLELQVKELYPRIQLRYTQVSEDRGLILEQEPEPGTIVRAGRRIRLVVSQGVMVNTVESYLGRNIDDVKMELQALNAGSGGTPLLSIKEPWMLEFSQEPAGTILQQSPEPGAGISGPTTLEFVVSRGPENRLVSIPDFRRLSVSEALKLIGQTNVDFTFILRDARAGEKGETVLYQVPQGGSLSPSNTRVSLTIAPPDDLKPGEVFGLFRYNMPKNPYPLKIRLEAQFPSGERRLLLASDYPGGELVVPYRVPENTVLILSMLNREIHRVTVY